MEDVDVARLFQQVADLLELRGDNPFRIRAYRNAARTIEAMPKRVAELVAHDGKSLAELPGIGNDLAGKIVGIVHSGHLGVLLVEIPKGLIEVMAVPGLGPKYGVFRGKRRVAGATEEDVFATVGLPYISRRSCARTVARSRPRASGRCRSSSSSSQHSVESKVDAW